MTSPAIKSFLQALFTGKKVSEEIFQARMLTCNTCQYQRKDYLGHYFCGICRCNVSYESIRLLNLCAYEENLPKWGCKHPKRRRGHGWRV